MLHSAAHPAPTLLPSGFDEIKVASFFAKSPGPRPNHPAILPLRRLARQRGCMPRSGDPFVSTAVASREVEMTAASPATTASPATAQVQPPSATPKSDTPDNAQPDVAPRSNRTAMLRAKAPILTRQPEERDPGTARPATARQPGQPVIATSVGWPLMAGAVDDPRGGSLPFTPPPRPQAETAVSAFGPDDEFIMR